MAERSTLEKQAQKDRTGQCTYIMVEVKREVAFITMSSMSVVSSRLDISASIYELQSSHDTTVQPWFLQQPPLSIVPVFGRDVAGGVLLDGVLGEMMTRTGFAKSSREPRSFSVCISLQSHAPVYMPNKKARESRRARCNGREKGRKGARRSRGSNDFITRP